MKKRNTHLERGSEKTLLKLLCEMPSEWQRAPVRPSASTQPHPVLSSSCLASLSLQANSSLKAVSCCVLKVLFCRLCSSRYDSSVYMGFIYLCIEDGHVGEL